MHHFRGSLAHYRLALVMPALLEDLWVSGCLAIERGPVRRQFFFREGQLVAASSSAPKEHLAQVLVDLGMLDPLAAVSSFEEAQASSHPYGAVLLERGILRPAQLALALQRKASEALLDCYCWESGEMQFSLGAPVADPHVGVGLSLSDLHRDGLARYRAFVAARATPLPKGSFPEPGVGALLEAAQQALREGNLEGAVDLIGRALERGPVAEGQALYRDAEVQLSDSASREIDLLEGRFAVAPLPTPPPRHLTADDLHLYLKLRAAPQLSAALRASAMGAIAAYRSLRQLFSAGLVRLDPSLGWGTWPFERPPAILPS